MVTARLFCTLICALFLCPQLYAEPPAPTAPTAPPQAPLTWADVTGDGIAEEIRLRAVVREGLSGFDFGVWNPVGDQYLGDIARMPDAPGMFGYVFGAGPDLDGDGLPEIWIADPAAREYVNGRGCVYVYSWQHSLPLMKLQGPPTDTLGTDIRIQTPDSGATWSVHVASHFQDIFGHVYQRWSQYSTAGQLQSTEPPSAGVLVLKSGDVDKTLSTDQADVEKVYQKAAELMLELGISGQKHDEDLDGNDLVDAADILAVINSLGVPEPSAASLTASSVYNVAPQRSLYNCSRCNYPCCYAGNCYCVTMIVPTPGLNPRWYAAHPGWWKPLSVPPGAVLPPGVYPDRRLTRTPQTPREGCDGFRILPGDIELGGIMVPAVFNPRTDTMTARIDNPSIAQFSADDAGNAMPRESGGDIKLRALLTSSQMIVSNGRIKMYGLIPGDTEIVVEFRTRVGTTTQVEEVRLPVKVGGRIEARVQKVRRWQAPPSWRADHKNAYDAAAAADLAAVRTYSPTGVPRIPIQEPMLGVANGRLGLNPERQGPDSEGEGDDKVLIWDACDQELTDKPTEYFTKRLFIGEDNDNDGISDPQTYLVGQSVNSARIQWSIMQGKGPFADATICEEAHRAEANPGSEIVAVVVGHAAERLRFDINRTPAGTPSNPAHTVSHIRNYYFPRVFGALMGEAGMPQLDPPMYQGGAPEFARWTHRDAGTEKYTPAYHRFNGQDVRFGRAFAPAELPTMEGTVQRQYITGATFAVPIINAALYEAIDKNFNRQETFGVLNLYDPALPQGLNVTPEFKPWSVFGRPDFNSDQHAFDRAAAVAWINRVNSTTSATQYFARSGLPPPTVVVPMTQAEWEAFIAEQTVDGEAWIKNGVFAAEMVTGFVPCADVAWFLYHGMMQVTGIDGEDHTWDLVGAGFGLAADLGYVGTVAGFVTNGSVAVVRIAIKLISKIDNGHTIRLILGHGDDVLKSVKRLIYYAMKHGDPYLQGLLDRLRTNPASVSAGEIAAASALFISKQSDRIVNSYRRMKHCRAVQVMGSMVDASGAPLMIRTYEEGVLAVNKAVFDRVKRVALTPRGAEGWYIVARMNNVPDADNVASALRGTLDAANNPAADELADAALENVGLACAKTADDFSPGHARAVQNAAHNAVRAYDSNLRGLVLGHIGLNPDGTKRAFATMAEFEALRVLPVDNLNDVQRLAIHAIRAGVIKPLAGARVTKVVPLSSRFLPGPHGPTEIPGAMSYLQNGHAGFGGYFMRQTDIPAPPASVMNRIRNDYDGSPLMPTDGYAVMETNLTQAMADTTRTPVNSVPPGGLASEYVQVTDGLPCTGNGFAGSVDGHLTSEWKTRTFNADVEVTTLSFKNANGTPNAITIGDVTTDRWVLRTNPMNPEEFQWFPLPRTEPAP